MHNEISITARKIFKSKIIKAAEHDYKYKFRYINMFLAIIDEVFIMPKVQHHDDTTFKSVNKPRNKERIGWGTKDCEKKKKDYRNMRERKYGLLDEYIENLNTPVIRRYPTLSDVPREPRQDFVLRYEIEARNHRYLDTHPTRVES